MAKEDDFDGMGELGDETSRQTDAALAAHEIAVLKKTATNPGAFRPQMSDPAAYDKLMALVAESTRKNESIAQLQARISQLGDGVVKVAKAAVQIASKTII